jgi:signal transduction histidine kinase
MIDGVRAQEGIKKAVSQGLIGMQGMLKDGLRDDIDEARDLIQDSISGLEELTELAQSLKDFSRLDRARTGDFNVNDGLDKTLLITKNKLKNKVTIHKHYGDIPLIHCSPSQINQVFLNLLTNSADAIEESGDIILRTRAENGKVRISVSDTGKGIPADILPKVRDPFFTTKEVGKGTGLGLSIVDQIVSAHGGELLIESQQGKGTTITVVLPVVALKPLDETGDAGDDAANDAEVDELAEAAVAADAPDEDAGIEADEVPEVATA